MSRLAVQLTLRGGKEALARLLVTLVAVGIGVAILLAVLADFHAFRTTNDRPFWEGTYPSASTATEHSTDRELLWNYSNDIFAGRTIERLDVAAVGRRPPVPPGIPSLPGAGQYYASPALARLLAATPADQLAARFPGTQVGTIGQPALTGPDELVIYVGRAPTELKALPATVAVTSISTATGRQVWSPYFRDAFVVGAVAFLFPILIFIGTATRIGATRREERYAAMRLVGATRGQIGVFAAIEAAIAATLGTLFGIGMFLIVRPWLAHSAVTSSRYFASYVTPTAAGYLAVLVAVPLAAGAAALLALQRVGVSPLGVSRRARPAQPSVSRLSLLLIGIVLFVAGVASTTPARLGLPALPGLLLIMIGLVVAGPWLTERAARLLPHLGSGAASLLASQRLRDNPKAAFRSVAVLVLAVFLGTVVAGLLPAVNSTTATPNAQALNNVLLADFTPSPICGNDVNCTGQIPGQSLDGPGSLESAPPKGALGLPASVSARLLSQIRSIPGATVVPIYALDSEQPANGNNAVIPCAGLNAIAALGKCDKGVDALQLNTESLFGDNPRFTTAAIAGPGLGNQGVAPRFNGLPLQAVLVKVDNSMTLERVRTALSPAMALSGSGSAPRTFGEGVDARLTLADTVERFIFIGVALTLIVAGCSIAVSVAVGLLERKRSFTLLRVSGASTGTIYRVVSLEGALPLTAATLTAAAVGYGASLVTAHKMSPPGTPLPGLGAEYFAIIGVGFLAAVVAVALSFPLLNRLTAPAGARFE